MKFLVYILPVLISVNLFSQPCQVDEWVKKNYLIDAKILSLRDMLSDDQHPCHDSVLIPSAIVSKYLGYISSVYTLHTETTDSVFNEYGIHVFPDVPYSGLHMIVDTSYAWISHYLNDSLVSGNEIFDSLASRYGFRLNYYYHYSTFSMMSIESDRVLNVSALVDVYEQMEGLSSVGTEQWAGDGNDIRRFNAGGVNYLEFSYGWMDCPAGCIYRHTWEFSVMECNAEYVRSYGTPFSLVEITESAESLIFPNPCGDQLYIFNPSEDRLNISLFSPAGELIMKAVSYSGYLDLSGIKTGMYILNIEKNGTRDSHKIIKY